MASFKVVFDAARRAVVWPGRRPLPWERGPLGVVLAGWGFGSIVVWTLSDFFVQPLVPRPRLVSLVPGVRAVPDVHRDGAPLWRCR